MAIRYSKEWKKNVSNGVKNYFNNLGELSEETRKKLSEAGRKGNKLRKYKKKNIEDLKSMTEIRKRLFKERGRKCEKCGWEEKNTFHDIVPIQVNHKDGNRNNNKDSNLEILCPNCHSLTEFFMFFGKTHKK